MKCLARTHFLLRFLLQTIKEERNRFAAVLYLAINNSQTPQCRVFLILNSDRVLFFRTLDDVLHY